MPVYFNEINPIFAGSFHVNELVKYKLNISGSRQKTFIKITNL
jgi:hypothetical protein